MSCALARTWPSIAPYRIEDFLMDVLEGENSNAVREGVRRRLVNVKKSFATPNQTSARKIKRFTPLPCCWQTQLPSATNRSEHRQAAIIVAQGSSDQWFL